MKIQSRLLSVMILAVLLLGSVVYTYARGGRGFRGGGGFAHREGGFSREGGFLREGPAADGGFASRSGLMQGRQQYGQRAQGFRQQEANALLSNREQLARNWQSRAQQYRRGYPYWDRYPGWDAGAGLAAAATGAAIGAAAGSSAGYPSASGAGYSAGQPCANAVVAPDTGVTYYNCGSAWYTKAYGPSGPVFVAVNRPPGL